MNPAYFIGGLIGVGLSTFAFGAGLAWLLSRGAYSKSRVEAAVAIALAILFALSLWGNADDQGFHFGILDLARLVMSAIAFNPIVRWLTPSPNGIK
jgi:hypothetical protein